MVIMAFGAVGFWPVTLAVATYVARVQSNKREAIAVSFSWLVLLLVSELSFRLKFFGFFAFVAPIFVAMLAGAFAECYAIESRVPSFVHGLALAASMTVLAIVCYPAWWESFFAPATTSDDSQGLGGFLILMTSWPLLCLWAYCCGSWLYRVVRTSAEWQLR